MPAIQTPCPECGAVRTHVVSSNLSECGFFVRRRHCRLCGHRWYTKQSPEVVISQYQLMWRGKRIVRLVSDV